MNKDKLGFLCRLTYQDFGADFEQRTRGSI